MCVCGVCDKENTGNAEQAKEGYLKEEGRRLNRQSEKKHTSVIACLSISSSGGPSAPVKLL